MQYSYFCLEYYAARIVKILNFFLLGFFSVTELRFHIGGSPPPVKMHERN